MDTPAASVPWNSLLAWGMRHNISREAYQALVETITKQHLESPALTDYPARYNDNTIIQEHRMAALYNLSFQSDLFPNAAWNLLELDEAAHPDIRHGGSSSQFDLLSNVAWNSLELGEAAYPDTSHENPSWNLLPGVPLPLTIDSVRWPLVPELVLEELNQPMNILDTQTSGTSSIYPINDYLVLSSTTESSALGLCDPPSFGSCFKCRLNRKSCSSTNISQRCKTCEISFPPSICLTVKLAENSVFQKWKNNTYVAPLSATWYTQQQSPGKLSLYHLPNGPCINVCSVEFISEDPDHMKLWAKTAMGWVSKPCPALRLAQAVDQRRLQHYVDQCTILCLGEVQNKWLTALLVGVGIKESNLLTLALRLWTANRLLIKCWQVKDDQHINDLYDPYFGISPAPRVVQYQMDHALEQLIVEVEQSFLKLLETTLLNRSIQREPEDQTFAAVLVFLATIESDTWRLMYWLLHNEEGYAWRHPDKPKQLVQRNLFCANRVIATLQQALDTPAYVGHLKRVVGDIAGATLYDATNDESLTLTLVKLAFTKGEFAVMID